jgi:hypothetical protein
MNDSFPRKTRPFDANESETLELPTVELRKPVDAHAVTESPAAVPVAAGFDPYKFQQMTVPAGFRKEMLAAKLPRLDPRYFHDTLPPDAPGPASLRPSNRSLRPPEGRTEPSTGVVLFGLFLTVVIAVCLFAALRPSSAASPEGAAASEPARPSDLALPASTAVAPAAAAPAPVVAPAPTTSTVPAEPTAPPVSKRHDKTKPPAPAPTNTASAKKFWAEPR